MSGGTYRVVITREDGQWLADVPSLEGAHTYAGSLPALDHASAGGCGPGRGPA